MSHGGSAVHRSGPTRRTSGPIRSVSGIRSESHDTPRRICPSPSPGLDTPRRICPSPSPGLDTPRRICPSPSPPLGDLGLRSPCLSSLSVSVCVVMTDFSCVPRLPQCTTGVQPHPESNQSDSDSGQVKLLKLATHTVLIVFYVCMCVYALLPL